MNSGYLKRRNKEVFDKRKRNQAGPPFGKGRGGRWVLGVRLVQHPAKVTKAAPKGEGTS